MQLLDGNQVKGLIKKKFDDVQRRINSRSDDGEVLSNIFFSFICFVYFIGYKIEEEMPNLSKTKVQTNFDSLYSKIIYSFIFSVNRLRER